MVTLLIATMPALACLDRVAEPENKTAQTQLIENCDPDVTVCEPTPVQSSTYNLRGAFYFSGWHPDACFYRPNQQLWDDVIEWNEQHPSDGYRQPHWWHDGYYDNDSQVLVDKQILGMYDAALDFVVFQTGWNLALESTPPCPPFWTHAIARFKTSQYKSLLRFAISWHEEDNYPTNANRWVARRDAGWTVADYRSRFATMVGYWRDNFLSDAQYLTLDGRLPIFILGTYDLLTPYSVFGDSLAHPRNMIKLLRDVVASGGRQAYVVGIAWTIDQVDSIVRWGVDAVSGYNYGNVYGSDWATYARSYRDYWWPNMANVVSLANSRYGMNARYFPPTIAGYDARPIGGGFRGVSTQNQYELHLQEARSFIGGQSSLTGEVLLNCCWSEWSEGSILERASHISFQKGTGHADAHRRVRKGLATGLRQPPRGWIDGIYNNYVLEGRALDDDAPSQLVEVHFYINGPYGTGTYIGAAGTDHYRGDVNSTFGVIGNHGWKFEIPPSYRDGQPHPMYVYGIDTSGEEAYNVTIGPAPYWFTAYP